MIFYFCPRSVDILDCKAIIELSSGIAYETIPTFEMSDIPTPVPKIYIYHQITDTSQTLYSFLTINDRSLFKDLISVDGIGCGTAAKLLLSNETDKIRIDIADKDSDALSKAKGIGKKTSEKIVLGLADKYFDYKSSKEIGVIPNNPISYEGTEEFRKKLLEINDLSIRGLVKLGFTKKQVIPKVKSILANYINNNNSQDYNGSFNCDHAVSNIITESLKELSNTPVRER